MTSITTAVHMHYQSLYIPMPFSAKKEEYKMTANFWYFDLESNAVTAWFLEPLAY